MEDHLFCFGLGFSARTFANAMRARGWTICGTSRSDEGVARLSASGFDGVRFDGTQPSAPVKATLARANRVLISISPDEAGDATLLHHGEDLARHAPQLKWIGYLSTIGVYGDAGGAWIDETTPTAPSSARGRHRVAAEEAWLQFGARHGVPVQLFRLAGIYGPGRSPLEKVRRGTARRIVKPGQVFNRIHVDDIAQVLRAASAADTGAGPAAPEVFNVCDDEPAPPQDVVAYAAGLLNVTPPDETAFEDADLSPMARSFYADNKRVRNDRVKDTYGLTMLYPTFREGLQALARDG
ncbi:MAG: SDR family oxidoreductase [Pseudomonadota bacterium]